MIALLFPSPSGLILASPPQDCDVTQGSGLRKAWLATLPLTSYVLSGKTLTFLSLCKMEALGYETRKTYFRLLARAYHLQSFNHATTQRPWKGPHEGV